jgi:ABC-type uncharacterized transport system permease subunit
MKSRYTHFISLAESSISLPCQFWNSSNIFFDYSGFLIISYVLTHTRAGTSLMAVGWEGGQAEAIGFGVFSQQQFAQFFSAGLSGG